MEIIKYSTEEAIVKAKEFVNKIHLLQQKYNMKLNSDCYLYLRYYTNEKETRLESIKIGWDDDGSGLMVFEKTKEELKEQEVLGLL